MEKITLYKDTNGNLWDYVGYDADNKLHQVIVVDEDDGHYTNTSITWYMTDEEFADCQAIKVEV